VESVRHDLVILVSLQKVYNRIATAIAQRQDPPPEVQELQEENRKRELELEEIEQQVVKYREEIAKVQKKEKEWQIELEHFQGQKAIVTNEREFTAVISEIDYATKALTEASERRAELEASIEQAAADMESRRQARPEEEAAHKDVVDAWEARKAELLAVVHKQSIEAKKLEEELHPKHRLSFLRLLKSKHGIAVSPVVEKSCSVCHFSIRPHLRQRVRRCEEIITCEHCYRILYFEETITVEPSEATTG